MKENEAGFYSPHIAMDLCVDCSLCAKTCPEANPVQKFPQGKCMAVWAEDDVRLVSSSGGAFTVLAREIFHRGGKACGAAFDESWTVMHILADNEEGLARLQGSKYVQSFVSETLYRDIKNLLKGGTWVLFAGTPCQVAALKKFMGKDYPTLLTVDLICSKVPPKRMLDRFLDESYTMQDIRKVEFRSKANGCSATTTTTTTTTDDAYFRMFLSSLSMNDSCVTCKYASVQRVGDLTIGDFWRIRRFAPELDDDKGTSVVLINSSAGMRFFNNLEWKMCQERPVENTVHGQRVLTAPFVPHQNRRFFAECVMQNGFHKAVDEALDSKRNVGILNWWWNSNRGAILTCYALQELIKELEYNPTVINYIPWIYYKKHYVGSISQKFADKYFNISRYVHMHSDMRSLNNQFHIFTTGSDQIWNNELNRWNSDFYYLDFAEIQKKENCGLGVFRYRQFQISTKSAKTA